MLDLISRIRVSFIFLTAFVTYQFFNFFYFPDNIIFGDEGRFIEEAINLYQSGEFVTFGSSRAWEMPLTAIIYSLILTFVGNEDYLIHAVRFFQSLLLLIQGLLIKKISLEIFNNELSSKLALLIFLFYPFFIFYQGLLLSENLFITFLLLSFYFLYKWGKHEQFLNKNFFITLICFSLAIYTKATISFLPIILMAVYSLFRSRNFIKSAQVLISSFVFLSILMSPWWIRNYLIFDSFVPFTTTSGKNMYLGNNLKNKTGGNDQRIDWDIKFSESVSQLTELERQSKYKNEAIKFMITEPQRAIELAFLKLKRFYSFTPNAPEYGKGIYFWASLLTYSPIFILSIGSILFYRFKLSELVPVYGLILYFTFIHMIFIASLRYRLPLEPFFIVLAAQSMILLKSRFTN